MVEHHEHRLRPEVTVRQHSIFLSSIYVIRSKKGNSNTDVSFPVLDAGSWLWEEYRQKGLWKFVVSWIYIFTLNPDGNTEVHQQLLSVNGARIAGHQNSCEFH